MMLPETWVRARLGDVLSRVDTKVDPQVSQRNGHFYIGLEDIESHTGRLLRESEEITEGSDILSIKTAFNAGDILYGKLRPNLNKVHLAAQDGICSTDIWALRASEAIMPEFALRYLRSHGVYVRAAQLATGANLPRISADAFDRLPIPLPTLPEQQRIVNLLRQAEVVVTTQKSIGEQVDHVIRTAYWEHFGKWFTAKGLIDPVRIGDYVADSQYGVSEAMDETGSHAVLRMNSITNSGWLDLSDLKYASLSKRDIESTQLQDGDLLFNRTNSKELVGKCAIWRPVEGDFSFASYLVRFRLKPEMLPEYLWATLNSAYGKYRLLNSAKQAVSMANVSPTDLQRITIPLPPRALQENFGKVVREVEKLRTQMMNKQEAYTELQEIISEKALIGELTAPWRELHANEIVDAVNARDVLLRGRGARISRGAKAVPPASVQADSTVPSGRHWLMGELSRFQRLVLSAFHGYEDQPLIAEDSDVFARFCEDEKVVRQLNTYKPSHNQIRRTLSQLSALGLIAKVTLPKLNSLTGQREYLKAFRPIREDERTRLTDVENLRRTLSGSQSGRTYHLTIEVDRETSERAGASGMFQVIDLSGTDGKRYTDLVDLGKHYESLDDVARDVARQLRVSAEQVILEE